MVNTQRGEPMPNKTIRRTIGRFDAPASQLSGILLGLAAKCLDTVAVDGSWRTIVLHHLADLFTRAGIWALIAILIAAFSKTMARAAVNTFLFFAGMLLGYYAYSARLFGFFPMTCFLYWGAVALLSPAGAAVVWLAKHDARLAWVLPALPAGVLLDFALGFDVYRPFSIWLAYPEELVMYAVACAVFYRTPRQLAVFSALSLAAAILLDWLVPFHF